MLRVPVFIALVSLSLCEFDPELHAKYRSMPHDEFVEYFNSQNYGYKIGSRPHLHSSHTSCAVIDKESYEKLPKIHHGPEAIAAAPANFDARQQWPNCQSISEIYSQGHCSSCWTFGPVTVASDRTCIHLNINVRLSEQDLECFTEKVCKPNWPSNTFGFWVSDGLVTQDCKPYDVAKILFNPSCTKQCVNGADYNGDKHFGERYYTVGSDDEQIMAELYQNGPIEASIRVYDDFRNYSQGIYEYKYGDEYSGHSVRIIGYGEEDGVQYWLGANSWGTNWGENGFFRAKRYDSHLNLEESLLTGMPKN